MTDNTNLQSEYQRNWRNKNKEKYQKYMKQYMSTYSKTDAAKASRKQYYIDNKEKLLAYAKARYIANKTKPTKGDEDVPTNN